MALQKDIASSQKDLTPLSTNDRQKKKELLAKQYQYLREKDKQTVRGKFIYHEVPGGAMSFSYGPIYKGDESQTYTLVDGEIYELPLGVARHLNKNVWYPEYGYVPGDSSTAMQGGYNPTAGGMKVTHKVRRVSFQSLEFLDIEEMPSGNISTVEKII